VRDNIVTLVEQLGAMPQAMKALGQWLLWRFEEYAGDKKPRKVPYYVNGRKRQGKQGDEADRAALASFDDALAALASGRWDGVGFAFLPGDGLVGIDIDGAIDPDTGEVTQRCADIIAASGSYTELSPSGKGVHIIALGETASFKDNRIGVEVFCGRQFFTCTGRVWTGAPDQCQPLPADTLDRLKALIERSKAAARVKSGAQPRSVAPSPSDQPQGPNDFQRVNAMALALLDAWVPALFPTARRVDQGFRVRQADLPGRSGLEEDLSITRDGIRDFGVHDMGDAKEGRRSAIDLVVEWRGLSEHEALVWLAAQLGVQMTKAIKAATRPGPAQAGRGGKKPAAEVESTPAPGSAKGSGGADDDDDRWRKVLGRTDGGGLKDCRENVFHLLSHHPDLKGLVAFDEFAYQIVKLRTPPWSSPGGEWSTNDDLELGLWLMLNEGLTIRSENTIIAGVGMAAWRAKFHPVRKYLEPLTWDGEDRLKHWLHECLGAEESTYHSMVGTWFVMGMVNRVLNPGSQMDSMICLEGRQGEGKSTALRILASDAWFADTPPKIGDKDAMLALAGIWLYEIAEMDSFNRSEVTAVKSYVTSRADRVREPYTRRHVTRPRSCVLGGTTNQDQYLKDSTGARRFWPVAVGELRLDILARIRDQLFAEAKHLLAQPGARYWPTREESKLHIEPVQNEREIQDPWLELVALWVDQLDQRMSKSFTVSELLLKACMVHPDKIDAGRSMATRIGIVMHKLGWVRRRDTSGHRLWRYWRPAPPEDGSADEAGGPVHSSMDEETAF
jgi:putative DNA primase/helicase